MGWMETARGRSWRLWPIRLVVQLGFLACVSDLILDHGGPGSEAPRSLVATAVEVTRMPDFRVFDDIERRKAAFFDFLRPIVVAENARIGEQRRRVLALDRKRRAGRPLAADERRWLATIAARYGVPMTGDEAALWRRLLSRVDTVPLRLVLAQAANESSWGTSRFARDGRNLFGIWCYRPGCGLVPRRRSAGSRHEVAVYPSVNASVAAYLLNLNRLDAYAAFRRLRADYVGRRQPVDALALAGTLAPYSERGQEYVRIIQAMIRRNAGLMDG